MNVYKGVPLHFKAHQKEKIGNREAVFRIVVGEENSMKGLSGDR